MPDDCVARSSFGSVTSSTLSGFGCCTGRMRFERLRAVDARLAGRNAQIDELARAEQPQVGVGREECVPVETRLDDQHLALLAAGLARGRADRIARFDREERLVAVDHVDGGERALEVRGELVVAERSCRVFAPPAAAA